MLPAMSRPAFACLLTLSLTLPAFAADAQTLYRYVDPSGRVVYSDQPPPAAAKDVQSKRLQENVIETDTTSLAAREAAEKYPVTLYTFDCDICKQAEAFLVKRGVPFKSVIVSEEDGAAKLKALTGKQSAPVLQVGEKQVLTGFSATRWQTVLDDAGYPKTPPQVRPPARAAAAAVPSAAPPAPEPAPPPQRGTDYPK
jgi:glutaredoxin